MMVSLYMANDGEDLGVGFIHSLVSNAREWRTAALSSASIIYMYMKKKKTKQSRSN